MTNECLSKGYGYRRIKLPNQRKLKKEHVLVWQKHPGDIPRGMDIHHINGDKLDNRIENLQLVTRLEHKRIHSVCQLHDGVWWKKCRNCKEFRPVDNFYNYPGRNGVMGLCKKCAGHLAVEYKRRRRQRLKLIALAASTILVPSVIPTATDSKKAQLEKAD
jgi:hypothetical protein